MYQYLSDYGNKNIKTSDKKFPYIKLHRSHNTKLL